MSFFTPTTYSIKIINYRLIIIFIALVSISILFFGTPKKSFAFGCPPYLCLDPVQDVEGGVTVGTTAVTAGATTMGTALQGSLWAKTFIGDALANAIAKQMIRQLTAQTVKWINTGFKGNPAYVTNPEQFFLNVADNAASRILSTNGPLNQLCSPFRANVRLALVKNYLNNDDQNFSCTLGLVEKNLTNFTKNFSDGGWESWFSMTQNQQNNPYGAYLRGADQISLQASVGIDKYQKQLDQGHGFLSYKKCTNWASGSVATKQEVESTKVCPLGTSENENHQCENFSGNVVDRVSDRTANNDPGGESAGDIGTDGKVCNRSEIVTPGSVIASQLNNVVKSPVAQLELTNSINQVVSALMIQLVQQVVGGIGNGLRGLSKSNSTSGSSRTFLEELVPSTATDANGNIINPTDANREDTSITNNIDQTKRNSLPKPIDTGIPTEAQIRSKNKADQQTLGAEFCTENPTDPACLPTPASPATAVDCTATPADPSCASTNPVRVRRQ